MELHHGAIRAIHNPDADSGTSFHFLLPIDRNAYRPDELSQAIAFEQAPKPKESVSVAAIGTPSPLPTDDHRPTVLVVDDDTEVLRFLRLILQPSYQVVTQSSAIEAIAWLSGATPDLIVSDVMMVGMDGYELCSRLKKDVTYCHLPIVLLTAKVSIEEHLRCRTRPAPAARRSGELTGFSSSSHFAASFKKQFGVLPSEYKG